MDKVVTAWSPLRPSPNPRLRRRFLRRGRLRSSGDRRRRPPGFLSSSARSVGESGPSGTESDGPHALVVPPRDGGRSDGCDLPLRPRPERRSSRKKPLRAAPPRHQRTDQREGRGRDVVERHPQTREPRGGSPASSLGGPGGRAPGRHAHFPVKERRSPVRVKFMRKWLAVYRGKATLTDLCSRHRARGCRDDRRSRRRRRA